MGNLCAHCKGVGGTITPSTREVEEKLAAHCDAFSEQEKQVIELYRQGLSLREIAGGTDLTQPRALTLLYKIEKKLREDIAEE